MRARIVSVASVLIGVVALIVVLYNATLVDRRAPTIAGVTLSAPVAGDQVLAQTLTAIDIRFSEPVLQSSVERRFRISPYVAGTITWDGATTAIFTPARKLPADTEFTVSIAPGYEDLAGNVATEGLVAWTFRTIGPPAVIDALPADGESGVPVDGPIVLRFDRLMDTGAVEQALDVDPAVPVRAAWSGQEVRLEPQGNLRFGTTYTVTVGTGAADTDGSRLREPFIVRFTTVDAGLRALSLVPAPDVAGVSVRSPVAIVFDAAIDPDSVQDALHLTPDVGGQTSVVELPSDESADARDPAGREARLRVLVFTPSTPLAAHTTYTVTLEPVVTRRGGAEVAEGRTWTFTTGQPTPSAQNQIGFLTARGGVRNVWLMNPDGSNPRQLTSELVPVSGFAASGDGSLVAWSAGGRVRVMRIDGSDERAMTPDDRFEYAPVFAPDGRSLLLARRDATGADLGYWLEPLPGVLDRDARQVLADGAPPLGSDLLTGEGIEASDGVPVWAPRAAFDASGERLLVTTATGAVRLVDLADDGPDGFVVRELDLVAASSPAWSVAGDRFLLVAAEAGGTATSLWGIDRDGRPERLGEAAGSSAASADGFVACLVRDGDGVTHVAVRRPSTDDEPHALTAGSGLFDRWPSFGPGSETIIFGRVTPQADGRSAGIWTVNRFTGQLRQLSTDGAYPRWLP